MSDGCSTSTLLLLVLTALHTATLLASGTLIDQHSVLPSSVATHVGVLQERAAFSLTTPAEPSLTTPAPFRAFDLPAFRTFSSRDFRPRGRSIVEEQAQASASDEAPMLHGSTVWQRLGDFRSRGGVRLLTLWQAGGSSVSLQAGKGGQPSLQWSSNSMNRGKAAHGVFDQIFSASIARAGRSRQLTTPLADHPESADKRARAPEAGIDR